MLGSLYDASTRLAAALMQSTAGSGEINPGSIAGASVTLPVLSLYEAGRAAGIPAEWLIPAP